MPKAPRIFLSYAHKDINKVRKLYRKLSDAGCKPWMDAKDIAGGESWAHSIAEALKQADLFIACLSRNSVKRRGWIQIEQKQALDNWRGKLSRDIYIIPLRLEKCGLPTDLDSFQAINLFEKNGWINLSRAIEKQTKFKLLVTSKTPRPKPPTPLHPTPPRRTASGRTSRLIGRVKEVQAMHQAIGEKRSRVLIFMGPGGMGKTRLLEEVGKIIQDRKDKPTLWSKIIDVYHAEAHSELGIREQIVRGLDPKGKYFKVYRKQAQTYRQHLVEGLMGPTLELEREQLAKVFLEDYTKLAAEYRIVLTFDTLELIEYEVEVVQQQCQIETETTLLKNWLLQEVPLLPNTVTILAGRPQKQRLAAISGTGYEDVEIWSQLKSKFRQTSGLFEPNEDVYELEEFTPDEAREYYRDLADRNPRLYQAIPSNALDAIFARTERRPIRLSLVIDLALHGTGGALAPLYAAATGVQPKIDEQLIEMLLDLEEPGRDVLLYLAAARKGLNADLMHHLDPEIPKAEWAIRLQRMKEYAFIKARPNTDEIFLHDELYELFERVSELAQRETAQHYYRRLADYYQQRKNDLDRKLKELRESEFADKEPFWQQRQEVMLALLHYQLQIDPKEGFEKYFVRWNDEAIESHQVDFDNRLRDELWRFLDSPVAQIPMVRSKIDLTEINRDSAVRWVRRYINRSDFAKARQVADNILASQDPLFKTQDPLFWGDLYCGYGEALWYLGEPGDKTVASLNRAIELLGNDTTAADRDPSRRDRILGRAYNNLGNHWQKVGSSAKTIDSFQHAISYLEDLPAEKSNVLNNMAYALAHLGQMALAQVQIEKAIKIRKELGQQYLLALSYNVQGYIHVFNDHTRWGVEYCDKALGIFRKLGDARGVGLALNGLGFASRKRGDQWKLKVEDSENSEKYFAQAEKYLLAALEIFPSKMNEPSQLWNACNELGGTYCDWGFFLADNQREEEAVEKRKASIEWQKKALDVARENQMTLNMIDSMDDLAQVCHDYGVWKEAEQWLIQIGNLIPKEYRIISDQGLPTIEQPEEEYWLALGKLHLQRGIWAFVNCARSIGDYQTELTSAVRNYALAITYFTQYWPQSYSIELAIRSFAKRLGDLSTAKAPQVRQIIQQIAEEYKINLNSMLAILNSTLGT